MNIIIFEDEHVNLLSPFCINHASFELKVGLFSNLERIKNLYKDSKITLIVREEIENLIKFRYPQYNINPKTIKEGLFLNGAVVLNEKLKFNNNLNSQGISNSRIYYMKIKDSIKIDNFQNLLKKRSNETNKNSYLNINLISYLWDIIDQLPKQISIDCKHLNISKKINKEKSIFLENQKNIYFKEDVNVKAGTVLDAEKGPIIIGKNVTLDIGSLIQGPAIIDDNSYVAPGSKIRSNTLVGKNCKVGGEISCSVIHANSNKVHDGFLGNSFISEWVNIGAGTNISNLKNNYNDIKFDFGDRIINTKQVFLGAFIGDFTRIGISTMLNTGTYIGLGANIFGDGFQKKTIPSFAWGKSQVVDIEKFIITCKKMKLRRKQDLSEPEIQFLKELYNLL